MQPPYTITPGILELTASISVLLGSLQGQYMATVTPLLRKRNRIRTIHASLQIEGNSLSEQQVTALLEEKRVAGPYKDILEVRNAIQVYHQMRTYRPNVERDFLRAHQHLMQGLIDSAGRYRKTSVGITKGNKLTHVAPPASRVPTLMKELFRYLKESKDPVLIKSCVFHYELEFIHPFADGNGRMGRLWQTRILTEEFPVFEHLPLESLIRDAKKEYYTALAQSDQQGHSTIFITFMLSRIHQLLQELPKNGGRRLHDIERLESFLLTNKDFFSRKEYMAFFPALSAPSASRDLKKGVDAGLLEVSGSGNATVYRSTGVI